MNNMPKEIQAISEKVELLHESSSRMIDVMERQIDAIISSNTNQIEELANLHSTLTIRYTENEQEFIEELSAILSSSQETKGLKLIALKELFPAYTKQIEYWQTLLQENVARLQQKHNQVVELLEFAMNNNARMLDKLYSKSSEKNKHYGPTGSTHSMMPGMALNHKA